MSLTRSESVSRYLKAQGISVQAGLELHVRIHRRGEPQNDEGTAWRYDGYPAGYDYWSDSKEAADKPATYPHEIYAHSIGSTGRNWATGESIYVAFDFDSITGHAAGVGVSDSELERVKAAAQALPYVEVRRSTGGGGLHLYVYLEGIVSADADDDVKTARQKHAAVGRAVLHKMGLDAAFNFADSVDVVGRNTWIWSVRATPDNGGLTILKHAERKLTLSDIPNWRDHIDVIARRRSKVKVDIDEALLTADQAPLTDRHRADMARWSKLGYTVVWVADHNCCQTHTCALRDDCANVIGIFETVSPGRNPGQPNSFLFPLPNRGWKVYRFGGATEAVTWTRGASGTWCYFDVPATLKLAAAAFGGVEDPEKGGYVFDTAEQAIKAAAALGHKVPLPEDMLQRETRLKEHKDHRLIVNVVKRPDDEGMKKFRWLAKKDCWVRAMGAIPHAPVEKHTWPIRVLVTPTNEEVGVVVRSRAGTWDYYRSESKIKAALQATGLSTKESTEALGDAVLDRWVVVNEPFGPEYLPGRRWNLYGAQYKVKPEAGQHPTYDAIYAHCGQNLTPAVKADPWCQEHGILDGRLYLMHWAANAIRHPFEMLPYIFLYGSEDCGKSSLGDSFEYLLSKGVVPADRALTDDSNFNYELESAIIARVEETDLSMSSVARNRLKNYVTNKTLAIRRMRQNQYTVRSTLHWIQTANDADYGNIPDGDTRCVVGFVPPLKQKIDRGLFAEQLEREAPHFLHTLLSLELASTGRLRLPVLGTREKRDNCSPLADYVEARLEFHPSAKVIKEHVYADYKKWCSETGADEMEDDAFGKRLKAYMKVRSIPFANDAKMEDEKGDRKNAYKGICLKAA